MTLTTIDLDNLSTISGGGAIGAIGRCIEAARFAGRFVEPSYRMGLMSAQTVLETMAEACTFAAKNPSWKKAL